MRIVWTSARAVVAERVIGEGERMARQPIAGWRIVLLRRVMLLPNILPERSPGNNGRAEVRLTSSETSMARARAKWQATLELAWGHYIASPGPIIR